MKKQNDNSFKDPKYMGPATIITGGAKRIGSVITKKLVGNGHKVVIHYNKSRGNANKLADELNTNEIKAITIKADLAKEKEVKNLFLRAKSIFGRINCVINNASEFEYDNIDNVTVESWNKHLIPNLRAPLILAKALKENLNSKGKGNIINIIDQRVLNLTPHFLSYTISKSSLWTLTRTLAMSLAPNIRVNAIGPGPTLKSKIQTENQFKKQYKRMLLKRGTTPEEISETVIFLLNMPSITGQIITLDGGQHLGWGLDNKKMDIDG